MNTDLSSSCIEENIALRREVAELKERIANQCRMIANLNSAIKLEHSRCVQKATTKAAVDETVIALKTKIAALELSLNQLHQRRKAQPPEPSEMRLLRSWYPEEHAHL